MHTFGELLFVVVAFGMAYGIPIAFAVWVLVTLRRIRDSQDEMRAKLDAIARSLRLA